MGLLDTVQPLLGYLIAIAITLVLAGMAFMAVVSAAIVTSATTMAEVFVLVAVLTGVVLATKQVE